MIPGEYSRLLDVAATVLLAGTALAIGRLSTGRAHRAWLAVAPAAWGAGMALSVWPEIYGREWIRLATGLGVLAALVELGRRALGRAGGWRAGPWIHAPVLLAALLVVWWAETPVAVEAPVSTATGTATVVGGLPSVERSRGGLGVVLAIFGCAAGFIAAGAWANRQSQRRPRATRVRGSATASASRA